MRTMIFVGALGFVLSHATMLRAVWLDVPVYERQSLLPDHAIGFKGSGGMYLHDVDMDGRADLILSSSGFVLYGTSAVCSFLVDLTSSNFLSCTQLLYSNGWPAASVRGVDTNSGQVLTVHEWLFSPSNGKIGAALIRGLTNRPSMVTVDPIPASHVQAIVGTENDFNGCELLDVDGDSHNDCVVAGFTLYSVSPWVLTSTIHIVYGPFESNVYYLGHSDGTNGFTVYGIEASVLSVGDVNGDGLEDLLCGPYILLGRTNKFPFAHATAAEVFDGTNGWAVNITAGKYSAVGDFNGDGLADWAAGTTIIFGSRSSLHGMTNLTDGTGVAFSYDAQRSVPPENFGDTIAGCGDVNADGYADFIVGSNHNNFPSYIDPHNAYIIYGRPLWPRCSMLLSNSFFDGVRGFIVQAAYDEKGMGRHVGGKGDFNGDGYDDPLIGATPDELYVFFGGESLAWPPALLSPVRVVDSTTGFREYDPGTNPYWDSTNVVVVGMKATNAAVYVRVNGTWQPGPVAAFGTRWFTNDLLWHMSQPLTIEYASSNALGWSANRTVLIVTAVPEPMQTGAWLTLLVAVGSRRHRANPNRQDAKDAKGRRAGQFNRRKDNHDKTA